VTGTQEPEDSFAFGGPLMSADDAVAILSARVQPVRDVETVEVGNADGRISAAEKRGRADIATRRR
jgi:molybdopterin molybdotransferase